MPSWISIGGIWKPAKERTVLPEDPQKGRPDPQIFEGEDRAARSELDQQKVDHLGMPSEQDPQVIMQARQLGMTVPEFMTMNKPPQVVIDQGEKAKDKFVQTHKNQPAKEGVKPQGGRAPGRPEEESGAFGDPPTDAQPTPGQGS